MPALNQIFQVHILPATHLELESSLVEVSSDNAYRGNVKIYTLLPETDEKVLFTDCSDVPFQVKVSDEEAFFVDHISGTNFKMPFSKALKCSCRFRCTCQIIP